MTPRDLEQLDKLCLQLWSTNYALLARAIPLGAAEVDGDITAVESGGRIHPWPGDPARVAALLSVEGYRVRPVTVTGAAGERGQIIGQIVRLVVEGRKFS